LVEADEEVVQMRILYDLAPLLLKRLIPRPIADVILQQQEILLVVPEFACNGSR
jgi:hypothetical protein